MSDTLNPGNENQIGRNEPCPCGSGKKYKRCCGVGAAPKLSVPNPTGPGAPQLPPGFDPNSLSTEEQQQMVQFAQAFQRLPKGQLQRLQSIMQRAMSGKDVTREAAELESSLPPDFQEMLKNFKMPNMPGMNLPAGLSGMGGDSEAALPSMEAAPEMSEEEARAIVAKAAEEGKITQDQAHSLLENPPKSGLPEGAGKGGISNLWKKLSGGKTT